MVDIQTQQAFEKLDPRAIAVVIDPLQSVKGKVVIESFRLITPYVMSQGAEPRITTSNKIPSPPDNEQLMRGFD